MRFRYEAKRLVPGDKNRIFSFGHSGGGAQSAVLGAAGDAAGNVLSLQEGGEGVATAGSYYDYVKAQVETSLNNFLADTEFPHTPSSAFNADMGAGGGSSSGKHSGSGPSGSSGAAPSGEPPSGMSGGPSGSSSKMGGEGESGSSSESTTYETVEDYIAALNGDAAWITYDAATNTAVISGLAGFANACKTPSKSMGAFDAFDRSQAENEVFGDDGNQGLHFDATMAVLLKENASAYAALSEWDEAYPSDYAQDRSYTDELGKSIDSRQEPYDPPYFLSAACEGSGTENFIAWVKECCA